jgi:hypothetical protein
MQLSRSFEPGVSTAVRAGSKALHGGAKQFLAEQDDERLELGGRLIFVRVFHGALKVNLTAVSALGGAKFLDSSVLRVTDLIGCLRARTAIARNSMADPPAARPYAPIGHAY